MDGNLTASDVALLTGNNRNDGMFGGDGAWWLIVLFLFAFCGWGNNGWGNNGNGGGYVATAATQADIQRGFDNSAVISKLVLDEMRGGYNDDYSERGRKRDSMGRYSSNDGRMMPDYDRGSSYARRGEHYVRGHYSRSDGRDAYDDYMTQKQSYRSGKSEDCKRKMLAALEEHLDELTTEMSDMSKDAECREERDLVKRYVEKLRDML